MIIMIINIIADLRHTHIYTNIRTHKEYHSRKNSPIQTLCVVVS